MTKKFSTHAKILSYRLSVLSYNEQFFTDTVTKSEWKERRQIMGKFPNIATLLNITSSLTYSLHQHGVYTPFCTAYNGQSNSCTCRCCVYWVYIQPFRTMLYPPADKVNPTETIIRQKFPSNSPMETGLNAVWQVIRHTRKCDNETCRVNLETDLIL